MQTVPATKKPTPRAALIDHVARRIAAFHPNERVSARLIHNVIDAAFYNESRAKVAGFIGYKPLWLALSARGFTRLQSDIASRVYWHKHNNTPAPRAD